MDNHATTPFSYCASIAFRPVDHIARMPDETDAKKILTADSWRTEGDHQDALVLRICRLSGRTWNPTTSPWM